MNPRLFSEEDQRIFAEATGDVNPMHIDAAAARRTIAGARVVHGAHTLLWLLDVIGAQHPDCPQIASIRARFTRMVTLGESVEAKLTEWNRTGFRAVASVGGAPAVQLTAAFGRIAKAEEGPELFSSEPALSPDAPLDRSFAELDGVSGSIALTAVADRLADLFPAAARLLGSRRAAALGRSSYLVGMVIPGLHSIYGSLALDLCTEPDADLPIAFRVVTADARFRLVRLSFHGGGFQGLLDTFLRPPPTTQPAIEIAAQSVSPGEFQGASVLVVGGSRGLGELTAKVIAAGGGRPIVTYVLGRADAERVRAEITAFGGECAILELDVRQDIETALASLEVAPSHVYYFATPPIQGANRDVFSQERFRTFADYYITGFYNVVQAAARRRPAGISAFYPSSIYVAERPSHLTEYAMAKAAGEILCADLNTQMQGVRVVAARLPRLPTDQTASLQKVEMADSLSVMLPLIREVQGNGSSGFAFLDDAF